MDGSLCHLAGGEELLVNVCLPRHFVCCFELQWGDWEVARVGEGKGRERGGNARVRKNFKMNIIRYNKYQKNLKDVM